MSRTSMRWHLAPVNLLHLQSLLAQELCLLCYGQPPAHYATWKLLSMLLQLAFLQRDAHDGGTRHHPLLCLEVLATAIAKLKLRSPCQADLLDVLERYMGCCATNERIARTPIPPPYSRCVCLLPHALSLCTCLDTRWQQLRARHVSWHAFTRAFS